MGINIKILGNVAGLRKRCNDSAVLSHIFLVWFSYAVEMFCTCLAVAMMNQIKWQPTFWGVICTCIFTYSTELQVQI